MENDDLLMVPLKSGDPDDVIDDPVDVIKLQGESKDTTLQMDEDNDSNSDADDNRYTSSNSCNHRHDVMDNDDDTYCVAVDSAAPPQTKAPSNSASRASSMTSVTLDTCRICHCEEEPTLPLISPCACAGSLEYVHQSCLQQWVKSADTKSCELCKYVFEMTTKVKPFRKWTRLDMSTVERRKIMCSVTFHIIAITCVIWSLYVLIDRTTEELHNDRLGWPFWTKLIVVAIGFTGGMVFMYVQCKMYGQLCRRWKTYNRVIYIQNAPDKKSIPLDMPVKVKSLK